MRREIREGSVESNGGQQSRHNGERGEDEKDEAGVTDGIRHVVAHGADVEYGAPDVSGIDGILDTRGHFLRGPGRADDEGGADGRHHEMRDIVVTDARGAHGGRHADYFQIIPPAGSVDGKDLSDGAFRPEPFGEGFIDNCHGAVGRDVVPGEVAAREQRGADHLQVAGSRALLRGEERREIGLVGAADAALLLISGEGQGTGGAGGLHSGKGANAFEDIALESPLLFRKPVALQAEGHAGGYDAGGFEAERRMQQIQERPQHQAATGQRHNGQADFGHDKRALQPSCPGSLCTRAAGSQGGRGFLRGQPPGGYQSEKEAGHQSQNRGEKRGRRVQTESRMQRDMGGVHSSDYFETEARAKKSEGGRGYSEDQAFRKELPDDPASFRAQGPPDLQFTMAGRTPREHQIRNVCTGDEKDETHGKGEQQQRGTGIVSHGFLQQPRGEAEFTAGAAVERRCLPALRAGVEIRVLPLELRGKCL